ncbi:MAG: PAS domain S-box protein [Bacteroidetes bacterium]|nr:PAS domain S-box protein [Bacteroidota bacterium]
MSAEDEIAVLRRMLERERNARKASERILEMKSRELYYVNEKLSEQNKTLETLIQSRTHELQISESRLKFAIERSGDGMWEVDFRTNEIIFSPRYKSVLGYLPHEFENNVDFWLSILHPDDLLRVLGVYKEYSTGLRSEHTLAFRMRSKREGWKWLLDSGCAVEVDEKRKPLRIIGVNTDISEQKHAEEELRLAADKLLHMITNLNSGVLLESETRHIEVINHTFCQIFSIPLSPAELRGMDCSQSAEQSKGLFEDPEGFIARINDLLQQKTAVTGEELIMADGRVLNRDYIPFFVNNEYKGHLWKYTDITAAKRYEQKLQEQEEKYRGIIENMNLGLIEVDLEEKIVYANQSFCNISGYTTDELLGRKTYDLLLPKELRQTFNSRQKERNQGISDAYEMQVRNKRGEARWWMISGAPMYDSKGTVIGSIGVHVDITDQMELEEQLRTARKLAEESAKAKESFMINMSHEIRTPMNAISGFGEQLLNTPLSGKQRTFVNAINSASANLLVIINDILDFSKIEAGQLTVERITFSLVDVVKTVCSILFSKAEEKGILLECKIDENLTPVLIGDPFRITQVLINLIGNSIKFTEQGKVSVQVTVIQNAKLGQEIELAVSDTGIGMSNEFLTQMFGKFSQEDDSTARMYGGTGLGMAITRELVELMGGSISVASTKGLGSVFKVNLLLPAGNSSDISVQHPDITPDGQLSGKTILLAEDNSYNQLLATTILERYGAEVIVCNDGAEAVLALEKRDADVVLMDVQMPVMDGVECTGIIRQLYGTGLPVVALTANALTGEREKCIAAGMDDFLSKPFEEQQLIQKVFKWIAIGSVILRENTMNDDYTPDLSRLLKIAAGDKVFLNKMLTIFVKETPAQLAEMKAACDAGDFVKMGRIAHRIKPSLNDVGISTNLLAEIETEGKNNNPVPQVSERFADLTDRVNGVIEHIRQFYL